MKPTDPYQLQRLVDGELDPEQIQQILAEAQATPQQWEDIAVSFVENQLWERAFDSQEPGITSEPTSSAMLEKNAGAKSLQSGWEPGPHSHPIRPRPNYSWLVMAASLMVAGMMGYMANQIQNRNIPSSEIADESSAPKTEPLIARNSPDESTPSPKLTPASLQPAYHLEVPEDNEYLQDVIAAGPVGPVPLYRIGNAEHLKQLNLQRESFRLPTEVIRRFNGSGYQMQQDIQFISGRLGDGRSFVVPVRTIRFVPGQ